MFRWVGKHELASSYKAFHRFGQAKFPDGGSILGSSRIHEILSKEGLSNEKLSRSDLSKDSL